LPFQGSILPCSACGFRESCIERAVSASSFRRRREKRKKRGRGKEKAPQLHRPTFFTLRTTFLTYLFLLLSPTPQPPKGGGGKGKKTGGREPFLPFLFLLFPPPSLPLRISPVNVERGKGKRGGMDSCSYLPSLQALRPLNTTSPSLSEGRKEKRRGREIDPLSSSIFYLF